MSMDVMIDLETTGTDAGCCVLSIGACTVDGQHKFYTKVDHRSCLAAGLTDNPATMAWWEKQSAEARVEAFSGEVPLMEALGKFSDWYAALPEYVKTKFVWGNGADFDLPILKAAYLAVDMAVPWYPFNGRCYRTMKNLFLDVPAPAFEGTKHNALADAVHQAKHLRMLLAHWSALTNK